MSPIPRLLYRTVLRTLPEHFRARHGGEMEELYHEALESAGGRGVLAWCYTAARGLVDVLALTARMRSKSRPSASRSSLTTTGIMESTLQDLRLAARSLAKAPGFTIVAVVTLTLAIGANTSIFTLVSAALLRACRAAGRARVDLHVVWRAHAVQRGVVP